MLMTNTVQCQVLYLESGKQFNFLNWLFRPYILCNLYGYAIMENVIYIDFLQIISIIDISLLVSNFICPHVSSTGWKYIIYKST